MAEGHGVIVNLSNGLPWIFDLNPPGVKSERKINYIEMPNIGGAYKERYFTGFGNKDVAIDLVALDMASPMGVAPTIQYFEALRSPAPGWKGLMSFIKGNANFPPPQILYFYGTGDLVPLVYDVIDIGLETDLPFGDKVRGVMGLPKMCKISMKISPDPDNILNKANEISKMTAAITASAESIVKEVLYKTKGGRKELLSMVPFKKRR